MATIKALENNRWQLSGEGISVTYGFSVDDGITLCEFSVLSENGNVNYCQRESSIVPIVNTDPCCENGRPPFRWNLLSVDFGETVYNKRPVQQLNISMETLLYKLTFHAVLFPGVSVVKQWWECENTSVARTNGFTLKPFSAEFGYSDYKNSYWLSTFAGGHTRPTQGDMTTKMLGGGMKYTIGGRMSYEYCPWITICCEEAPYDGIMLALDYMGEWEMVLDCNGLTTYTVTYTADGGKQIELFAKQKLTLPAMTFAAFNGSHDALMQVLYDWQYRYMFDATSDKYFAATKNLGPWYCSDLLVTEQFAQRATAFDLENAEMAQLTGANGTWSDAGWYAALKTCPGALFQNSLEGPDFRESMKYAQKTGLGYTLWFSGSKILNGVMDSKGNYWGDFEWRTDAFNMRNQREYLLAKEKVERFTDVTPERAFHSCNGGGSYMHNFEIQRLTSYNYTSDCNHSPYINYYTSFFEIPDKQCDLINSGEDVLKYNGASSLGVAYKKDRSYKASDRYRFSRLANIPTAASFGVRGPYPDQNFDLARMQNAIYEYMKRKGVAGRFSYEFHPRVFGDKEYYYRLRTSQDKTKAVLVCSRGMDRKVTVYPDGLLPELEYEVVFHYSRQRFVATGKDMQENGIVIPAAEIPELIWFNLPDYPFGGHTPTAKSPVAVYKRYETNVKTNGVGIYIAAEDDAGKFYYSIKRNGEEIMKLANGCFFFDRSAAADISAVYAVSAVDFDGKETETVQAQTIECLPAVVSAVGCHSTATDSFCGFSFECSEDGKTFVPMKRIPCPGVCCPDIAGDSNRIGGLEGYFEACGNTRIGRAYQQAGDKMAARVYTADRDQTVRVTGNVMRNYYHNTVKYPVRVSIFRNEEQLWSAFIPGGQDVSRPHDLTVELKQGDKLRFVTHKVKMPRETIYPADLQEDGYPHPTEPADQDAVVLSWAPLITDLAAPQYADGLLTISLDGEDACYAGAKFRGQKIEPVDGKLDLTFDAPAILNNLLFWFDSDDKFMDEGYVTIKVNGRTLYRNFDVVREKDRKGNLLRKDCKSVLAVDGKVHLEITLSGGAKLKYFAMAPVNEFRGFCAMGQNKYIDWSGDVWEKPVIRGGKPVTTDVTVEQALPTLYDASFYKTARAGKEFEAEINVPDGIYTVRVLTSNAWKFDGREPEFDVYINDQLVAEDYNTEKIAEGAQIALTLRFEGVIPENGKIRVRFKATGKAPAVVTAIAVD